MNSGDIISGSRNGSNNMQSILEHPKNIFLKLSEMDSVLKIGGHLIIRIPKLAALHNRFFSLFGR